MYLTKAQSLVDKGSRCSTKKFAKMSRRADKVLKKIHLGKNLLRRYKIQCCARARARGKAQKAARNKKAKEGCSCSGGQESGTEDELVRRQGVGPRLVPVSRCHA